MMRDKRFNYGLLVAMSLMIWSGSSLATQAQSLKLSGTLILASNEAGQPDKRIANIVPQLKRMFGFSHYAHFGSGGATLNAPGNATMNLGNGYSIKISGQPAGKSIAASIQLLRGGKVAMKSSTKISKGGAPTIMGGLTHGKGKIIVYITAK